MFPSPSKVNGRPLSAEVQRPLNGRKYVILTIGVCR